MLSVPAAIVAAAGQYGVPSSLALSVGQAESGLNPNVPPSRAGAIGVMQLMPATAAMLGVDPTDPQQNIQGGVRYLAMLLSEFGDPVAAIAAYNWGPAHVADAIAAWGPTWLAQAPAETQAYVSRVLGVNASQYQQTAQAPAPATDGSTIDSTGAVSEAGMLPSTFADALPWVGLLAAGAVIWVAGSGR